VKVKNPKHPAYRGVQDSSSKNDPGREARPADAGKPRSRTPAIEEKHPATPNVIGVVIGR
jgi:hypothetical protein